MELKDYPQIGKERKDKILAMSDAEILIEIEKGNRSTMPRAIPFMKAVLEERRSSKQDSIVENDQNHKKSMLQEAREANASSKQANRFSILALIISLVAIVLSLVKGS